MRKIKSLLLALSASTLAVVPLAALSCNDTESTERKQQLNAEKTSTLASLDGKLNTLNVLAPTEYKNLKGRAELLKAELNAKDEKSITEADVKSLRDFVKELNDKITSLSTVVLGRAQDELDQAKSDVVSLQAKVDKLSKELKKLGVDVDVILNGQTGSGNTLVSSDKVKELTQELNTQKALLDSAKDKVATLSKKLIARGTSAIDAIKMISRLNLFMIDSVKNLNPELYNTEENKRMFELYRSQIQETIKDADSIELSYANSIRVYNALRDAMAFSNVQRIILEQTVQFESPFPKQDFMDELFNWRIADLQKLLDSQKEKLAEANKMNESESKTAKVARFTNNVDQVDKILRTYQQAQSESKTLKEQIAKYMLLEVEAFDKNIKNPSTADEFQGKYDVNYRLSALPLLNGIVDKEALAEIQKVAEKISPLYTEFYGKNYLYLTSIKYANYYESFSKDLVDLKRYNLIQDLYSKKSIITYLNQFKYKLDTYKVDTASELAKIQAEIEKSLKKANDAITKYNKLYNDLVDQEKENTARAKLYKALSVHLSNLRVEANKGRQDDIRSAFDKLLKYKKIESEAKTFETMLDYFKNLNLTVDNKELNKYLKLDEQEAKANKKIETAKKQLQEYESIINEYVTLVKSFKAMKFDATDAAKIKMQAKENVAVIDKFVADLKAKKVVVESLGETPYYFGTGDDEMNKQIDALLEKVDQFKTKLVSIDSDADSEIVAKYAKLKDEAVELGLRFYVDNDSEEEYDKADKLNITSSPIDNTLSDKEQAQSNIRRQTKKAKEYKENSLIIPLNEVYILMRQGAISNSDFFTKYSVTDLYKQVDSDAYEITTGELKRLQQSNQFFRSVTGVKADTTPDEEYDFDPVTEAKNLDKLEKDYYNANVAYLFGVEKQAANLESLKEKLKTARDAYYTQLRNAKLDGKVYINELNPIANYDFAEGEDSHNPATILITLADFNSVRDLLLFIKEQQPNFE
ncbi:hypothetical protein [Mycoplasma sp. CR]|uniref:hypothetical protein n=1 Tax=Mycoplasma sp. CR TaxID=3401693 RepID=UPI003AAC2099